MLGYEQSKKFYKYILKKDSDDQLTFLSNLGIRKLIIKKELINYIKQVELKQVLLLQW